jgi:hypothetical protein
VFSSSKGIIYADVTWARRICCWGLLMVCAVDADKDSDQLSARKDDNQRNLAFLLEKVEGCAVSTFLSDTAYNLFGIL